MSLCTVIIVPKGAKDAPIVLTRTPDNAKGRVSNDVESFNGRFRDERLNEHWFLTMEHARQSRWRTISSRARGDTTVLHGTLQRLLDVTVTR